MYFACLDMVAYSPSTSGRNGQTPPALLHLTSDVLIVDPAALLSDMEAQRKENKTYRMGDA